MVEITSDSKNMAVITYELDDEYSHRLFQIASNANEVQSILQEIDRELRAIYKYGSSTFFGENFKEKNDDYCESPIKNLICMIREKLYDAIIE